MKFFLSWFFCLLFVCTGYSRAASADDHAQATLLANVLAVQPGKPFMLGVRFEIDPGWHIYWKNPGDSGLPTQLKLTLPDGFTQSELMFPVPERLQLPGDIVNYAYENQVMLMVRITPPTNLIDGKPISITGKASWLVCKDDCRPGGATLSLQLPVANAEVPATNEDLFRQWTADLPVKHAPDVESITGSLTRSGETAQGSINVTWKKPPADLLFLPGPLESGDVRDVTLNTSGGLTKLTFTIKRFKGDEPVTGLLTFTSAAGVKTGVDVSIPASNK